MGVNALEILVKSISAAYHKAEIRYYVKARYSEHVIIVADIANEYDGGNELMFRPDQFVRIVDDVLLFDDILYDIVELDRFNVMEARRHIITTYCESDWKCPGVIIGNVLIVFDPLKVVLSSWSGRLSE